MSEPINELAKPSSWVLRLGSLRLRLVDNWHQVLKRAWSVRLMLLAGLFSGLEAAWPLLGSALPVSQTFFSVMTGLTVAAAFVSRLVAQKGINDAHPKDPVD